MLRGIHHSPWGTANGRGGPKIVRPIGTEAVLGGNLIMCRREPPENQTYSMFSFWPQRVTSVSCLKQLNKFKLFMHKTWGIRHWMRTGYTGHGDWTGGAAAEQDTKTAAVGYPAVCLHGCWPRTHLVPQSLLRMATPVFKQIGMTLQENFAIRHRKLCKKKIQFLQCVKKGAYWNNLKAWATSSEKGCFCCRKCQDAGKTSLCVL